jgi:hypothetical protein
LSPVASKRKRVTGVGVGTGVGLGAGDGVGEGVGLGVADGVGVGVGELAEIAPLPQPEINNMESNKKERRATMDGCFIKALTETSSQDTSPTHTLSIRNSGNRKQAAGWRVVLRSSHLQGGYLISVMISTNNLITRDCISDCLY